MAEQPNQPQPDQDDAGETQVTPQPAALTPAQKLRRAWLRLPRRYRTNPWWIVGSALALALMMFMLGDCAYKAMQTTDAPPEPVAAAVEPTPTPTAGLIPDRPTPTPLPTVVVQRFRQFKWKGKMSV